MNYFKHIIVVAITVAVGCALLTAIAVEDDDTFILHTVKKGETISLLCIEIYGHYNKPLAAAIMRDNPAIKNIDVIYVGQQLRFRQPVSGATKAATAVDSVFRQKVDATQGVVTYVEGRAFLKKQGASTFEKLAANSEVFPGDVIKTGKNGRVELIINRESVVRLKENTELSIEAYRDLKKKEGKTALNFSVGSLWTKVKQFKDKIGRFELEMPTAIAGVHGTIYQATVHSDSSAEVKVYDGEVQVSGKAQEARGKPRLMSKPFPISGPRQVSLEEWTQIVRAMQAIRIDKNGQPSEPADFQKNIADSWERWNEERDKRISEIFSEK